jgi:putative ABC transport system permease protein
VLVAAIDPIEEAKLVGLPRTVVFGRYLSETDDVRYHQRCFDCGPILPALISTATYIDNSLLFEIERLHLARPTKVPPALLGPAAPRFLTALRGTVVADKTFSVASRYPAALAYATEWKPNAGKRGFGVFNYWTIDDVRYRTVGLDRLRAVSVENSPQVWRSRGYLSGWLPASPGSRDTGFRRLHNHSDNRTSCGPTAAGFRAVGRFDPHKLRGFSPLSRVPLESYSPPEATPADADSRGVLGGRTLRPTLNLSDYIVQPPLMLTNLRSAMRFLGRWVPVRGCTSKGDRPSIFQGTTYKAPISAIRVRVAGVSGPDALSLERIKVVAQKIHDKTGLDVDITAGSSPHPLLVELPAGRFGRPELLLREGWSKKGVSVTFLRALDRKDLLLFVLILAICAFFLSNGALAAVRARRAEIGTLRTLGWPSKAIFGVVLAELLGIGFLAGVFGGALALLIIVIFGLDLELWRVVLVIPLAVGLALVWERWRWRTYAACQPAHFWAPRALSSVLVP